ncbi:hypothetical protein [Alkalimarinus sediminis]|uniref:Lipoprotein SmpA/OmlA domain-containing protein n=1 Tax=Alkalimarinus sediminis TaxID=1632866 RepID=A0A9E8HL43_9ALTE|nr:hypothetical protein [Alkalimarinus sediminis]UZW76127.1 hypothetical protein NNL22_06000 [Alkalimarinus sediminis]
MRNRSIIATSLLAACLLSPLSHSETIRIGLSQQAEENKNINRPQVGMSMESVKSYFGAPPSMSGPTGKPAIYKWKYADFTVYFEGEYVIHSVLHPSKAETKSNEQP